MFYTFYDRRVQLFYTYSYVICNFDQSDKTGVMWLTPRTKYVLTSTYKEMEYAAILIFIWVASLTN